jgi:hypothetical protein
MKKLIALILLFSATANATCDWKTGITPGPNKTFIYTEECHQAVGALVKANADLTTALDLKNAALVIADQRTALWEKTSDDELSRLNAIETDQKHNDFLYFGLGILATIGTGFAVAKLVGK